MRSCPDSDIETESIYIAGYLSSARDEYRVQHDNILFGHRHNFFIVWKLSKDDSWNTTKIPIFATTIISQHGLEKRSHIFNIFIDRFHVCSLQMDVGTRTYRYIAAQGPMENTVTDFWQMAWEQNVQIIVAATDDKVSVL